MVIYLSFVAQRLTHCVVSVNRNTTQVQNRGCAQRLIEVAMDFAKQVIVEKTKGIRKFHGERKYYNTDKQVCHSQREDERVSRCVELFEVNDGDYDKEVSTNSHNR